MAASCAQSGLTSITRSAGSRTAKPIENVAPRPGSSTVLGGPIRSPSNTSEPSTFALCTVAENGPGSTSAAVPLTIVTMKRTAAGKPPAPAATSDGVNGAGRPTVRLTWLLTSAGPCVQRLVGDDGLGAADVTLANTPSPNQTAVDLLVRKHECASGRSAEGRIDVELKETAEQVLLRVAVDRLDGDQSCQGNPATPFTVELADPLGDREVVDSSVVPARPVPVDQPE